MRPTYKFNESCQETVPQAITAFLESTDFEDAIRNAISICGDPDTLAAITGSIAEAAYGIPGLIEDKAWTYLDEPLKDVCVVGESSASNPNSAIAVKKIKLLRSILCPRGEKRYGKQRSQTN
ncbi:MAG: ADP-ribosylglycohydrolase family protein [Clostridiales bacterium]|nr:ADP-ribosylglycohydrolase family protein [Clostridiales bacterium]